MISIPFNNRYVNLGELFYVKTLPTTVANPALIKLNDEHANDLGLSVTSLEDCADVFSGNVIPDGASPLAMAYAGHQFGNWAGQLGDGRAINLFEVGHNDKRWAIQLKGSGATPYSRQGDGCAVLSSSSRE